VDIHLCGQVLGLGKEYVDYTQKVEWYLQHVANNASIAEDDVVLLIDAYDVLVAPAIRRIGEVLLPQSPYYHQY
jgi:hypothetical protein